MRLILWRWPWANVSRGSKWLQWASSSCWSVTSSPSPHSLMDTTVTPTTTAGFLVRKPNGTTRAQNVRKTLHVFKNTVEKSWYKIFNFTHHCRDHLDSHRNSLSLNRKKKQSRSSFLSIYLTLKKKKKTCKNQMIKCWIVHPGNIKRVFEVIYWICATALERFLQKNWNPVFKKEQNIKRNHSSSNFLSSIHLFFATERQKLRDDGFFLGVCSSVFQQNIPWTSG